MLPPMAAASVFRAVALPPGSLPLLRRGTSVLFSLAVLGAGGVLTCLFKVLSRFLKRLQSLPCALLYCLKRLLIGRERSTKHTQRCLHPRCQFLQSFLLLLQFLHQGTRRLDMVLYKLHGVHKR